MLRCWPRISRNACYRIHLFIPETLTPHRATTNQTFPLESFLNLGILFDIFCSTSSLSLSWYYVKLLSVSDRLYSRLKWKASLSRAGTQPTRPRAHGLRPTSTAVDSRVPSATPLVQSSLIRDAVPLLSTISRRDCAL
jgi:hypothetical protein